MTALPRIVVENEPARIYHIHTFGGWTIDIDFNLPESSQPELERLTALVGTLVEAECPAAKCFGVTGVGEGIVWNCVTAGYTNLKFKVKGELHANPGPTIGNGKTKAAATHPDVVQSIQAFVDEYVSEARLHQGLTILDERGLPRSLKSMGYFIKWVQGDVLKEEADTIAANALNARTLIAPIAANARGWFKQAVAAYT
ncbi:hypothetical protein H257_10949 [Aphanomyces astaci]|uniref:Uncharacterized protein n=1 Tax=Aphanomyces astaci TaxID=112090 RepID=W4G5M1_APHAT|nr:hypothetical protein H257_10949 [Aphanomyces astaci]ETV74354.1 hypothetical protein H257_10949 [Aphanomyces astaci]|eukprot:XP_009836012.1 hypothetical protein H257_10949 [Aphanomyces astaci]